MDDARALLRHIVATLAYRARKTVGDAPPHFAGYSVTPGSRTPGAILAHMGDLIDWALSQAQGRKARRESPPLAWDDEVARFFASLEAFDAYLASGAPLESPLERLFQGPISDALTHTGQLALLRRAAGSAMRGENYGKADISVGAVAATPSVPRVAVT